MAAVRWNKRNIRKCIRKKKKAGTIRGVLSWLFLLVHHFVDFIDGNVCGGIQDDHPKNCVRGMVAFQIWNKVVCCQQNDNIKNNEDDCD